MVLMPSVLLYIVENGQTKENPVDEWVCTNFGLVPCISVVNIVKCHLKKKNNLKSYLTCKLLVNFSDMTCGVFAETLFSVCILFLGVVQTRTCWCL